MYFTLYSGKCRPSVHTVTRSIRVFRTSKIRLMLENMDNERLYRLALIFSRRYSGIELMKRNGSNAGALECAFHDYRTSCNVIHCQNRMFSAGPSMPSAHLLRNAGMQNAECTSRIAASECAMQG